jgi:hypothetical protein
VARRSKLPCYRPLIEILENRTLPSFVYAGNYAVGDEPWFVAVGDFNGDGTPDLAAANRRSGTVSVLLGNGDGTFQAGQTLSSGGNAPLSVAVADFNGDGKQDLAVAYTANREVVVFLGNGDGTFQAPTRYQLRGSYSVAVGDFNGDGTPDLAVAENITVSVLLGNGDGTFQAPVSYAVGDQPWSVAVGDFNGDGIPDLAVANAGDGTASVLLGNGDGTFQAALNYAVGSDPRSVAVGDFNGDGFPDLAVTNYTDPGTVSVLLNAADWGGRPSPAPSNPHRPALHAPSHGQAQLDLSFAEFVAPQPQTTLRSSLVSAGQPPAPTQQAAPGIWVGLTSQREPTFTPFPLFTARHTLDAVFEAWGDPVVDVLAMDLLR